MKIIIGGYARFLNKIARKEINPDEYLIAVNIDHFKTMIILIKNAFEGMLIESEPGETYDDFTGTDCTISTAGLDHLADNDILIPVHKNTVLLMAGK